MRKNVSCLSYCQELLLFQLLPRATAVPVLLELSFSISALLAQLFFSNARSIALSALLMILILTALRLLCADYNRYKEEAEAANMRKEGLWDEAKHLGSVGDKNADRKVADMEKRLQV